MLRPEYQRWVTYGDVLLTPEGGWPMDVPVSAAETWSTIMYLLATAAEQLGRYSEATRFTAVTPDSAPAHGARLRESIDRLAAAVLQLFDVAVDEPALMAEATGFVDEVADEDDGLMHTSDRLGSFLQAHLVCAEDHIELPDSEKAAAMVAILAPLLAQSACLAAFEDVTRPVGKRSAPPPADIEMVVA